MSQLFRLLNETVLHILNEADNGKFKPDFGLPFEATLDPDAFEEHLKKSLKAAEEYPNVNLRDLEQELRTKYKTEPFVQKWILGREIRPPEGSREAAWLKLVIEATRTGEKYPSYREWLGTVNKTSNLPGASEISTGTAATPKPKSTPTPVSTPAAGEAVGPQATPAPSSSTPPVQPPTNIGGRGDREGSESDSSSKTAKRFGRGLDIMFGAYGVPGSIEATQDFAKIVADKLPPEFQMTQGKERARIRGELGAEAVTRGIANIGMAGVGATEAIRTSAKLPIAIPAVDKWAKETKAMSDAKKVLEPVGKGIENVSRKLIAPAMSLNKLSRGALELERERPAAASREGLDATQWAALMFKGARPQMYGTYGTGQQFIRGGVQNFLDRLETSERTGKPMSTIDNIGDAAGVGLGVGLKTGLPLAKGLADKKAAEKEFIEQGIRRLSNTGLRVTEREAGQLFAKEAAKQGTKALFKTMGKQIPLVGAAVALPFAITRAAEGDWSGAGLELASAVPVAGLAADVYLAKRDFDKSMEEYQKGANERQRIRDALDQEEAQKKAELRSAAQTGKPDYTRSPGPAGMEFGQVVAGYNPVKDKEQSEEESISEEFVSKRFAKTLMEQGMNRKPI